jgi:Sulfotransferase domain
MPLEVIGAGFGRTGTKSLQGALEELGFDPCYHMSVLFEHPEHVPLWEAAARGGKSVDWNELFGGYRATTDWPACSFYEELMHSYPDAKVILTVRDPNRWYESTYDTIYAVRRMASSPVFRGLRLLGLRQFDANTFLLLVLRAGALVGLFRPGMGRAAGLNDRLIWEDTFDGNLEDRQHAIEVFERHNEEVKRRVPVERLLVYEINEGWGPLCDFLGVAEPDKPFPHLNDTHTFRKGIRRRIIFALAVPIAGVSLAGLALLRLRKRSS